MTSVKEAPRVALSHVNVKPIFATPLISHLWPDSGALNAALRTLILEHEAEDPGIVASNMNAWHSRTDFLKRKVPCVEELQRRLTALMAEVLRQTAEPSSDLRGAAMKAEGWATVLRDGGYHVVHNHPGHMWSGVYYVASGDDASSGGAGGAIVFVDPRTGANMITTPGDPFSKRYQIAPKAGLMIMFPSWLGHFVHPFAGSGERITVSFNVNIRLNGARAADSA